MADDPKKKTEKGATAVPGPNPVEHLTDEEYKAQLEASAQSEDGKPAAQEPSKLKQWWDKFNGVMSKPREFSEMGRSAGRGVVEAGAGLVQTISEGAAAVDRHTGLGEKLSPGFNDSYDRMGGARGVAQAFAAPFQESVDKTIGRRSDDGLAAFTESATQFITGFAAFNTGILKGPGAVKALAKGALADATVMEPYEAQLAELAANSNVPGLSHLGEILSVKGDDNAAVARLKRAAAGAIPGATLDGLIAAARGIKASQLIAGGAKGAEKDGAMEILLNSQKVLSDISNGTHVAEGSHVKVVDHGNGTFSVQPIHEAGGEPARNVFTDVEKAKAEMHATDAEVTAQVGAPVPERAPATTPATDGPQAAEPWHDTPLFSDRIEATQQAESIDNAIQARDTAGEVKPLDIEAIWHAFDNGTDLPLTASRHNSVEQDLELVKRLSDGIVEKRSALEASTGGSITVEQGKQLAKETLAQIPQERLHETMKGLLKANPESQDIVSMAADMVLGQKGRDIVKLHDVLEARPHDEVALAEMKQSLQNYFDLRDATHPGESAAARRLRFTQDRVEMRKETFDTAQAAKPAAETKSVHVDAADETKVAISDVRDALEELKNKTDTDAVNAADFSLNRARKKVEAALKKIEDGDKSFEHDPELAQQRAADIKDGADAQRADPISLTPEEAAAAKAVKTKTVNPIEQLSHLLDGAERKLDAAREAAGLPKRVKPQESTPLQDLLRKNKEEQAAAQGLNVRKIKDASGASTDAANPTEFGNVNLDGEQAPGPVEGLQGNSLDNLATDADKIVEKLKTMKASEKVPTPDVAGMKTRDASATALSDAQVKYLARMFKLADGAPRDADAIINAATVMQKGGFMRGALEVFTNGLLSGPPTWATVTLSGQAISLMEPVVKMAAGAIGGNRAMIREGVDTLFGLYSYLGDNIRIAGMSMREGRSIINPAPSTYAISGILGRVVRAPGNVMMGLDEFTRVANYRAHVRAQSLRMGREAGLEGAALARRVDQDLRAAFDQNTGIATIPQSLKYADRATLSGALEPGFAKSLQDFTNDALTAKFVVPFVRASANIFDYAWQSAPGLNLFNKRAQAEIAKGGEAAAALHARSLLATTVGLYAYLQAKQGTLTGKGPSDPELRKAWLKDNQPYSIRVGNSWVSYNRMDPVATPLGLIADLHVFSEELGHDHMDTEKATYAILGALVANLSSKTYTRGIIDVADAWGKGDPNAVGRYLQRQGSSMAVPNLINKVNPDPYYREVESMMDAVKSRMPYFSTTLDARFNMFGEKILKAPGLANRALNPMTVQPATESKVERELLAIGKSLSPAPEKLMNGLVNLHDKGYAAKKDQPSPYVRMMQLVESPGHGLPSLRKAMEHEISQPQWNQLSDGTDDFLGGTKLARLAGLKERYEQAALRQVLLEYPKLHEHLISVQRGRGAAMRGGEAGVSQVEALTGPIHR
jgi:hypothetical protein